MKRKIKRKKHKYVPFPLTHKNIMKGLETLLEVHLTDELTCTL